MARPRSAWLLSLLTCACPSPPSPSTSSGSASAAPVPRTAVSVAPLPPLSFQPMARGDRQPRSQDGVPILVAKPAAADREGDVVWVRAAFKATDSLPEHEASDGESIYLVIDQDSSVLVRDGVVHEDVMKRYGVERGGCGAAREGALLLSGVAPTGETQEVVQVDGSTGKRTVTTRPATGQIVVRVDAHGKEQRIAVPPEFGSEQDCRAWLESDGRFALGLFGIVEHDGNSFRKDAPGLGWYTGRTVMGKVGGPRFCFWSCNGTEEKETHPDTKKLLAALDFRSGPMVDWIAMDDWVAGAKPGRAVRMKVGGAVETVDFAAESKMLNGSLTLAFTKQADLVIGLDYRFRRYMVWPRGKAGLSAVRELAKGEVIAHASPTVLVKGLTSAMPESNTFAVLLGKHIGVETGGSTYEYQDLRRSIDAHRARFARAKQVLNKGSLVAAHEAVIDTTCGSYVRSPLGWEGMVIHDWTPPTLPALSAAAVFKPTTCVPLSQVSALPGDPDLLLGISKGDLYAAWLPPPLPLPPGTSHFHPNPPPPAHPVTPRPGGGWTRVGKVSSLHGDDGVAEPGGDTAIAEHSWQAGGAAVIVVEGATVLITKRGAVTLPTNTKPMAVGQNAALHVFGALGSKLVECREVCRVLDPGPQSDIVAVVPRTETQVVLGYADGRLGSYTPPKQGGKQVAQAPIVAALAKVLAAKPKP